MHVEFAASPSARVHDDDTISRRSIAGRAEVFRVPPGPPVAAARRPNRRAAARGTASVPLSAARIRLPAAAVFAPSSRGSGETTRRRRGGGGGGVVVVVAIIIISYRRTVVPKTAATPRDLSTIFLPSPIPPLVSGGLARVFVNSFGPFEHGAVFVGQTPGGDVRFFRFTRSYLSREIIDDRKSSTRRRRNHADSSENTSV